MSILIATIVIGFVVFIIALPWRDKEAGYGTLFTDVPSSSRKNLKDEKASLVLALKELDFDYETGKLSKEDYKSMRDKYESRAVAVMKQLDEAEVQWKRIQDEISSQLAKSKS